MAQAQIRTKYLTLLIQSSFVFVAGLSFVLNIVEILRHPEQFQWDLRVYYNGPLELSWEGLSKSFACEVTEKNVRRIKRNLNGLIDIF